MAALVDTGAGRSAVSAEMAKKLHAKLMPLRNGDLKYIATADGTLVNIIGCVTLFVDVSGNALPFEFCVLNKLSSGVIFGMDFLNENEAIIDCSGRTISFFNDAVKLDLRRRHAGSIAVLTEDYVFPAMTETMIKIRTTHKFDNQDCLISEANTHDSLIVARSISSLHNGQTMCRVLNNTTNPIHLRRNAQIAKVEPLEGEILATLDDDVLGHNPQKLSVPHCTTARQPPPCKVADGIDISHEKTNTNSSATLSDLGLTINRNNLTDEQHDRLTQLLQQNTDIFAKSLADLKGSDLHTHDIDTGDAPPQRVRNYRHSPAAKAEIERQTLEMLEHGIIEPSNSMWSAPCVLVKKKDGSMRFCIDYRKLNSVTKAISFPLPTIDDIVDAMSENKPTIFSLLDMRSGYFQIGLSETSMDKTTFSTHQSSWRFRKMPFGIRNAPAAFSMLMSQVFRGLVLKYLLAYIDDILVFSKTFDEHLLHLQTVFDRLRGANLRLHPKKCNFALERLVYIGHVLSKDGISVDESKIDVVRSYPRPKSLKDVRSVLGFFGYYRRFVKGFSLLAAPLYALLKKDVNFSWSDDCEQAFQSLKTAMTTTPVLAFADLNKEFIVTTDASAIAIGWVLSQIGDDGKEHPIAFSGRSTRPTERAWSTTDLECLALCEAIKEYHAFLSHRQFTVYTDHISLTWLQTLKASTGRLFRWSLLLQPYNMRIVHKAGKIISHVDALSRREYPPPPAEKLDDEVVNDEMTFASLEPTKTSETCFEATFDYKDAGHSLIKGTDDVVDNEEQSNGDVLLQSNCESIMAIDNVDELQRLCPDLGRIITFLETGDLPRNEKLARQTVFEADDYFFKERTLYHQHLQRRKQLDKIEPVLEQLAVPRSLRSKLLQEYHDNNGHPGFDRCYEALRSKYFWPRLYAEVRAYCKSCNVCQRAKINSHFRKAPLNPLPASPLFARYHMDFLGPLPKTKDGYKHILLIVESLSRYPFAIALKTQETSEVARVLYDEVFTKFGAPVSILTDRGQTFLSKLVTNLCQLFDVKRTKTSSFRPQCNSQAETFNKTILKCLRCYCENQEDWADYLQGIMAAYRATPCLASTGLSPFRVLFGTEMRLPIDNELNIPSSGKYKDADEYIKRMLPKIEMMRKIAQENVTTGQERYKTNYDKTSAPPSYETGDRVWLHDPTTLKGQSKKLKIRWEGPFYITAKVGPCNYLIRRCDTHKEMSHAVHSDRLKRYHERDEQPGEAQTDTDTEADENSFDDETTPVKTTDKKEPIVTGPRDNPVACNNSWHPVKQLLGVKSIRGRRHYKVQWEQPGHPTEWVDETNVSDFLKRTYHVKRTQTGLLRKQFQRGRHKTRNK